MKTDQEGFSEVLIIENPSSITRLRYPWARGDVLPPHLMAAAILKLSDTLSNMHEDDRRAHPSKSDRSVALTDDPNTDIFREAAALIASNAQLCKGFAAWPGGRVQENYTTEQDKSPASGLDKAFRKGQVTQAVESCCQQCSSNDRCKAFHIDLNTAHLRCKLAMCHEKNVQKCLRPVPEPGEKLHGPMKEVRNAGCDKSGFEHGLVLAGEFVINTVFAARAGFVEKRCRRWESKNIVAHCTFTHLYHTYARTHAHTHTCTYVHALLRARTHTHTHTLTTHTQCNARQALGCE
jgi:hypothetical protein